MKKIRVMIVFLMLGMFSGNVMAVSCDEYCRGEGFSGGDCYTESCPVGTYFTGGPSVLCYYNEVCCCYYEPTSTTVPSTTTTIEPPTTTTTIPGAMEFGSLGIAVAVLLTTPAFAYLLVKRKGV